MLTTKALSLRMAQKMADATEQKAMELGLKIAIAIMDNHGNLKYFRRMDGILYQQHSCAFSLISRMLPM